MSAGTMDRRVRKTRNTLRLCLGKLLQEKPIQNISVKEISELADINRGTFYLHYKDVYDLLAHTEQELFEQYSELLERHSSLNESAIALFEDLLNMIQENTDLVRVLLGPNGDLQFLNQLRDLFRIKIIEPWAKNMFRTPPEDQQFFYTYIIDGSIGIIKLWVQTESDIPAKELAKMITQYALEGAAGLGMSIPG